MYRPTVLLFTLAFSLAVSSELNPQPDNSQLYDGPYIQVYPPVDLSQDQQSCSPQNSSTGTCPLYIGLMMSFGGDYDSSGSIPGVQLALDQINADPNLLPGYTLHYTLLDSKCQRTSALDALLPQIIHTPTKIGVIGAGCSVATEPTGEISHYFNITQISCVSSSNELSNRERYRYYFQLLADEADSSFGFFEIIRYFEWQNVAFIVQDENLFTLTIDKLKMLLTGANVNTSHDTRFRSEDGIESLGENPFDTDARIFVLSMYSPRARELLCRAYQNGIRYPQYQLIVIGWYAPNWWVGSEEEQREVLAKFGCNATQRESVLPYTLSPLQTEFITDFTSIVDSGINGSTYVSLYKYYQEQFPFNITDQIYSQQCYDATWTLAIALNQTIASISENASLQEYFEQFDSNLSLAPDEEFGLQHFTYNNSGVLRSIFENIEATAITGITGRIHFNESTGVRTVGTATVYSYLYNEDNGPEERELQITEVGLVNFFNHSDVTFNFTNGHSEKTIWGDAGRPYDGIAGEQDVTVSVPHAVILIFLAIAGIVFAIICLVFNLKFKRRKLIRLSSPKLNIIIGLGAIILYLDVICFVVPTTHPTAVSFLCNITPWLTALGYSLCYGTIVAKMFRVYYIFNNPTPKKKKAIKDWMLVLAVGLLLMIDFIILFTYTTVEGAGGNLNTERVANRENPEDITGARGIITRYFFYICDSQARDITLGILYGYKALLQVIALVFTFSIRKVKIEGLNDAIYVTAAVYVTSIVTAVIFVSTYTLKEYINAYAAVLGGGFLIGTTGILMLIFVPKMIFLYYDPQGENVFISDTSNLSGSLTNQLMVRSKDDIIVELRTQVEHLLKEKFQQGQQVAGDIQKRPKH